jgi:uncharacterized protein (DUF2147 family)
MLISTLLLASAAPAAAIEPVTGRWLTDSKDGIVRIGRCGNALCGRLVETLTPIEGPPVDRNNPDPALRDRPIIGLPVLTGFRPDGTVWAGTAYDPKVGKSYRTTLERIAPDTLKVRGCVAIFCRSVLWTRAPR